MRERLRVTQLEACITLVNEIYRYSGHGHYSEAVARTLHGVLWKDWYHPEERPLTPAHIIHDAQRSQLLIGRVNEALATLPNQEQRWTRRRFGLEGGVINTLAELGDEFGCTRERVRQVTAKALRKLRHPSRSNYLREFLPE